MFAETGDETVARSAVTLMDHFIARYESPSGLWHREYNYRTDTVAAIAGKTRGQGWAMEGLLALDRIHPGMHYRDRATRMARELIQHQRPDGSWLTILDGDEAEHGVSEKGTALWSLLLYQLYEQTGETEFLYPARNALKWCLEHQYGGPDPNGVGGIPGTSPHSGVVYRNWFPMICGYTCGFAGLAMMKELEIRG